jgi:hypothetical protein
VCAEVGRDGRRRDWGGARCGLNSLEQRVFLWPLAGNMLDNVYAAGE